MFPSTYPQVRGLLVGPPPATSPLPPNTYLHLQSTSMNNLHVHDEFPPTIINHQHSDAPTALAERTLDPGKQTTLVNDRQALLDITGLGHGDDQAVLSDVQDAVLLEHGAEHGLHHDAGGRVADERTLLVQLAGEQVHAKVPVLARLAAHADADDLRRPALEQQNVADADEVALDGNALAAEPGLDVADLLDGAVADAHRS